MNITRNGVIALVIVAALFGATGYFLGHGTTASSSPAPMASAPQPAATGGKGRVLYYRNPMGLPDTSPAPKKDAMGMDYVPVYENEAGGDAGVVTVDPARVQMLGVRTETVTPRQAINRSVRAAGTVAFDERRLAAVTTKVAGWIEKLNVAATGEAVRQGQPLLEIYSPEIVAAEQEYLVVASTHLGGKDDALMLDAALSRLRVLDVPAGEIARLQRTGRATRRIAVLAPANGVVTEKTAVLGAHVDAGAPLYKTADLSTVWLIAEVQEQDLGLVRVGQKAAANFVAFPGRSFEGRVDFIYPVLSSDTRTAKVRITMPNTDLLLRSEMYASVAIEAPASTSTVSVLSVSDSAIIDSGARQIVLVAKGQGRFEPRVVKLGARGEGYTEVLSGLQAGESVVTSANFLIDAESNLRAALQAFTSGQGVKP
ncbi:MAG: efflux RND transporter periplasmic adaptor subunit [Alphaproteobacteria bacterium]|nr:efflux RND transporter periplasmic adaptor subunit [Reyranella sp.]MBL6940114.1 efflux RND transporter periplasmic adaptor subunit [Alphaproteobacteria bacterium]MBL7100201.1 efflux RND transporter periplasmic adaptor subunit [Alphaproteobacteria bacterium]